MTRRKLLLPLGGGEEAEPGGGAACPGAKNTIRQRPRGSAPVGCGGFERRRAGGGREERREAGFPVIG